jgi:hypothetical protein
MWMNSASTCGAMAIWSPADITLASEQCPQCVGVNRVRVLAMNQLPISSR